MYPDEDLTFQMCGDLDSYDFQMEDCVQDIFCKYFHRHSMQAVVTDPFIIPEDEKNRIFAEVLKLDEPPALFG